LVPFGSLKKKKKKKKKEKKESTRPEENKQEIRPGIRNGEAPPRSDHVPQAAGHCHRPSL
jgi:hypothetical protein